QFFDGEDRRRLLEHVRELRSSYGEDVREAIDDMWSVSPPPQYYIALLRQLCDPHYSLKATTVGYVLPSQRVHVTRELAALVPSLREEDCLAISISFISDMLDDWAFDSQSELSPSVRQQAARFPKESWASKGVLNRQVKSALASEL